MKKKIGKCLQSKQHIASNKGGKGKNDMKKILLLTFVFAFFLSAASAFSEVVVIVNSSVSVDSLSAAEVKDIYTGKMTKFSDGTKIKVVMLKTGSMHDSFMNDVVGESPSKISNIWKKVIFTGKGKPPKIVKSAADMVKTVKSKSGAIGYADSSDDLTGVKVIKLN